MIKRRLERTESYRFFGVSGAKSLIVFIHGLGGSYEATYWGRIPDFIIRDQKFDKSDFLFWQYPSYKLPIPTLFARLFKKRRLPKISLVARALETTLRTFAGRYSYKKVILVGHSQGGLIAFHCLRNNAISRGAVFITSVAVLGSPFKAPDIAQAAGAVSYPNEQIIDLSKDTELQDLMVEGLEACRAGGTRTAYFGALEDAVVDPANIYRLFDVYEIVPGGHVWTAEVGDAANSGYAALIRFLESNLGADG